MKTVIWIIVAVGLSVYLSLLIMFGGNFSYKPYKLRSGAVVECRMKYLSRGVVHLKYCKDGKQYSEDKT